MDIRTLVSQMMDNGEFMKIARNPLAQFQAPRRRYIGAEILPERPVEENAYTEHQVSWRTVIANDGTRYSPVQKKGGDLTGSVKVELGESDIGRELTGREFDALLKLLDRQGDLEAMARVTNWTDTVLNRALLEKSEQQRWQAIVNAEVVRQGDNGYTETVEFPDPTGHRVTAATPWSTDSYDPFNDIFAIADLLYSKGFMVSRIISSRKVVSILSGNDKVKSRTNRIVVSTTGQISGASGRADSMSINSALQADGLPAIEQYDLQYRTQTGSVRFLPDDCMVFVCQTGRDENIDLGDGRLLPIPDTLGYYGVGRAQGQPSSGRVIKVDYQDKKPVGLTGEAYQTSFPVILEPEAFAVIKGIS